MNRGATTVDEYFQELPAWQAKNLELFRQLAHEVDPLVSEAIKWGVPVFMHAGKTVLAMSSFKNHTKYNFILNGAQLDDKDKLFNNSLESKRSRSIDLTEGQSIDHGQLKSLIGQAFTLAR